MTLDSMCSEGGGGVAHCSQQQEPHENYMKSDAPMALQDLSRPASDTMHRDIPYAEVNVICETPAHQHTHTPTHMMGHA